MAATPRVLRARCLALGLLGSIMSIMSIMPSPALADPAPPSAAEREAAQRAFSQAQHAFRRGDFRHAAEEFEAAYGHAPHPDVLWNAARAWHRAREFARAANLYAKFLRDAPADARDRNSATTELRELSQKLARLDVVAPDFQELRVDEQPLDGTSVYVTPGAHVVDGKLDGRLVRQTPTVAAGDVVSVALVAPSPSAPAPVAAVPAPASTDVTKDEGVKTGRHGLPPVVVWIGAGATAVATGITVWSAVDTEQARSHYNGTPQALDDGLDKERRTNVLVVVSSGLGAFTLLSTLLFVDWHSSSKPATPPSGVTVKVGAGLGSVSLGGTF